MDVSVVITCWNGKKLLEKNLSSVVAAAENPKNNITEIIVVDDGSTDDSVEFIESFKESKFQSFKVRLIKHDNNYGYSRTCNTGVKESKEELVAILNLDVVPSKNFLVETLPHFKDEKVFAVTFNEGKFGPGKLVWKNGFLGIAATKLPKKSSLTGWPNGGSSVFRKAIWEKLGGMDEIYLPFYFEDIDLGMKAYKAGYHCLFEPRSKVEHEHEATINAKNFKEKYIRRIKERNLLLLTWKNIDSLFLIVSHLAGLLKKSFFNPGYFRIIVKALKRIGILPLFLGSEKELEELLSTEEVLKINEKIV